MEWSAVVSVILLAIVDYSLGPDRSGTAIYLLPIGLVAWYGRSGLAYEVAALSAFASMAAWAFALQGPAEGAEFQTHVAAWNVGIDLVLFLTVSGLVAWLKEAVRAQWDLALSDPLTGLANTPGFFARLGSEIERSLRYGRAFTVVYLDLDRFKDINDTLGHSEGDEVLRRLADTMRTAMRASDLTARLGGDEFGIILPEAGFTEAAGALEKLRGELQWAMRDRGWPVTVSVGAVTFETPPANADVATRVADGLMYAAKHEGGDRVRHVVWNRGSSKHEAQRA